MAAVVHRLTADHAAAGDVAAGAGPNRPAADGRASPVEAAAAPHRNEVVLVGRVAAAPVSRALPSGDVLVTFRLVVQRPRVGSPAPGPRTPTVDTIDCVALRAAVRRGAARWEAGDVVEVTGALRRRFWRGPAGPVSRCEVEVQRARRLARPSTTVRPRRAAPVSGDADEAH